MCVFNFIFLDLQEKDNTFHFTWLSLFLKQILVTLLWFSYHKMVWFSFQNFTSSNQKNQELVIIDWIEHYPLFLLRGKEKNVEDKGVFEIVG